MVEITLRDDKLILERIENGRERKGFCEFPLENIAGAVPDSMLAQNWFRKLDFLASYIPNVTKPGIEHTDGDCAFWGIEKTDKPIIIFLENEHHNRLVVGVKDAHSAVTLIENALQERYREITATEEAEETA